MKTKLLHTFVASVACAAFAFAVAAVTVPASMAKPAPKAPVAAQAPALSPEEAVFFTGFNKADDFNKFKVIDVNHDNSTWTWNADALDGNPHTRYMASDDNNGDDWLLTPEINLENDKSYILTFKYRRGYSTEKMAVAWGQGEDPAAYAVIEKEIEIDNHEYKTYTAEVTPTQSGKFRFGFHAISDKGTFYIALDDIKVAIGSKTTAPDSVKNLTITPYQQGKISATITMTTPGVDGKGKAIDKLTKLEILRNDTVVETIQNPAINSQISKEVAGGNCGMNKYAAIAYNESGAGRKAEGKAYLGYDTPVAPTNAKVIDNGSTLTVKWEAVTSQKGIHGGWVDLKNLTYNIMCLDTTIATEYDETEFIDDDAEINGSKIQLKQYFVSAVTAAGESPKSQTNWISVGRPWQLPVIESFAWGQFQMQGWWNPLFTNPHWSGDRSKSYDDDEGCVSFKMLAGQTYATGNINSHKITMRNVPKPYLSFAVYVTPGANNQLKVIASKLQSDSVLLTTVDFTDKKYDKEGWYKFNMPINDLKNVDNFVLTFQAITRDKAPIYLDNVEIKERKDNDLAASIAVDKWVKIGKDFPVTVTISNEGALPQPTYTVDLYMDNKKMATAEGKNIGGSALERFNFNIKASVQSADSIQFYAVVNCPNDQVKNNNTSKTLLAEMVKNLHLEPVANLEGQVDGQDVKLSWSTPEQPEVVTESFEKYRPFSINYLGDWDLVDQDQAVTYALSEYHFPHEGEPYAFIVFNPELTNKPLPVSENPMVKPHSGNQFLAAFPAVNNLLTGLRTANNDYLLSTLLNGKKQTVKFWARSTFADNGKGISLKEAFRAGAIKRVGENDFQVDTLIKVLDVPAEWTEYTMELGPEYDIFFINCISDNKFMFQIDDITYAPKPYTLLSYNIYRDGEFYKNVTGTNFTDAGAGQEKHYYEVSVLYKDSPEHSNGESNLSNKWGTPNTGVTDVNATDIEITGMQGYIHITKATGNQVVVYNVNGQIVDSRMVNNEAYIPASAGVYIVRVGAQAKRIIVK